MPDSLFGASRARHPLAAAGSSELQVPLLQYPGKKVTRGFRPKRRLRMSNAEWASLASLAPVVILRRNPAMGCAAGASKVHPQAIEGVVPICALRRQRIH